jgi:hypothetical protein
VVHYPVLVLRMRQDAKTFLLDGGNDPLADIVGLDRV